ncbi:MAG TPA: hypothetical protein VND93_03790, partial [Myxococcales bacterium]|nr:hypothetical protein [Myxococcales bacterium]
MPGRPLNPRMQPSLTTFALSSALLLAACGGPLAVPEAADPQTGTDLGMETARVDGTSRCTKEEIDNRELLHNYHVQIWEQGRWDLLGNYLAPDFFSHAVPVLPGGQVPGA